MKNLTKYGLYALLALSAPMAFQSCNDDKDIVLIDEDLPLIADHIYGVGATPNGWSLDTAPELVKNPDNQFEFTYKGALSTGELKFLLSKSFDGPTIYAPASGTEIGANGAASDKIDVRTGGDDNKWNVTKAGNYTITFDLKNFTITAKYEGETQAEPFAAFTATDVKLIGAAGNGWSLSNMIALTQDAANADLWRYTGLLNEGKFKLAANGTTDWGGDFIHPMGGDVTIDGTLGTVNTGIKCYAGGDDYQWDVTKAGNYDITFNTQTGEVKVESFTAVAVNPWATDHFYMVGDAAAGWDIPTALEVKKVGDKFQYAGELKEGSLKFISNKNADFGNAAKYWFYASAANVEINEHGAANNLLVASEDNATDNKFKVTKAGNYVLTIDPTAHTLTAVYTGPVTDLPTTKLYIIGVASATGWNMPGGEMTKVQGTDQVFTWTGRLEAGETFKFSLDLNHDGNWGDMLYAPAADAEVGSTGITNGDVVYKGSDNKFKVTHAGQYKITVNGTKKKINIEYLGA